MNSSHQNKIEMQKKNLNLIVTAISKGIYYNLHAHKKLDPSAMNFNLLPTLKCIRLKDLHRTFANCIQPQLTKTGDKLVRIFAR